MQDLFGKALFDYYQEKLSTPLLLHNKFSTPDELDLEGYFFDEENFTELEMYALSLCEGKILDVGAAAGRHCLYLTENGKDVTGLDTSAYCCRLMEMRGLKNVINSDIFDFRSLKFDTLLMLMNGIGLVGDIDGLKIFLEHAASLLNRGGQIIFDSSDISYLKDSYSLPKKDYCGEIDYQYEYEGIKGTWFKWLYVDAKTLQKIANACGWQSQIIFNSDDGQFLARLLKR